MSHSSACVLVERPHGGWMEKLFTFFFPKSQSLWQFRALSPAYKAGLIVALFSLKPLFWSGEEATTKMLHLLLGCYTV